MNRFKHIWKEESATLKKADYIILGIIILLYSILSFYNLGSNINPQTYVHLDTDDAVVIELTGDATDVTKVRAFAGPELGTYRLYGSQDGITYQYIKDMELTSVFSWFDTELDANLKYLKAVATSDDVYLGEIQLYDRYGYKLEEQAGDDFSLRSADELDTVPSQISYMNSTYFDEIYFARTAYEYAHGMTAYEWVHPPLGKVIQMIPILFMGMTAFAYRLMGNIAGIAMIAVLYVFAKNMFKKRKYAIMAALLMAFDTFHFAQSRMGTVDTFLVLFILLAYLFMYKYISKSKEEKLSKRLGLLALSGLFMGMSIATKWTGCFAALGLAILFFYHLIKNNFGKGKKWTKDTTIIVLSCVGFFVIVPLVIYIGIYFLFPNLVPYPIHNLSDLWKQTQAVYEYHSTLDATHPFTSPWYSWPIMWKPVWYYVAYFAGNMKQTIAGIGNPAIWWAGAVALFYILYRAIFKKDGNSAFLLVAFLTGFLPYLFIGRIMFLYHYFPVLPFVMLALVAMFKGITERTKSDKFMIVFLIVVAILFAIFLPIASGRMMPEEYINAMRWLPEWFF